MAISDNQKDILNRMNRSANKVQLGTVIQDLEQNQNQDLAIGSILIGDGSDAPAALDISGDAEILVGNGTTATAVAMSGEASIDNAGAVTLDLSGHTAGKLSVQFSLAGGASNSSIIKETATAGETFTGTHAGLSIKEYDADNSVVHNESELCGLYVNLKQLSAMANGGKSALISAHNYGSGGDYQVLDFGLRLFGDIVDAIEVTGGTVTSAIKLDTCSALTNVFKLADGVGCKVGAMTAKDPENDAEAGYITISVGGTSYEIPFYAVS